MSIVYVHVFVQLCVKTSDIDHQGTTYQVVNTGVIKICHVFIVTDTVSVFYTEYEVKN